MMGASSPSERWCSSPPTPVTPGSWSRQTNSPPDSPPAEIRCRCTSKKPKPVTPSAGKDTTESRARCSSMKTPARTVSSLSRATRYSNSFALSTKRIATSCNGVAFKFQICLASFHPRAAPRKQPRRQESGMEEAKHFIGNQWVAAASHETIPVLDPSDGQIFAQLARGNAADIDRAVQAARHAYEGPWG